MGKKKIIATRTNKLRSEDESLKKTLVCMGNGALFEQHTVTIPKYLTIIFAVRVKHITYEKQFLSLRKLTVKCVMSCNVFAVSFALVWRIFNLFSLLVGNFCDRHRKMKALVLRNARRVFV